MCGADLDTFEAAPDAVGSSPRVRSRHGVRVDPDALGGIISACAEQTGLLVIRAETT